MTILLLASLLGAQQAAPPPTPPPPQTTSAAKPPADRALVFDMGEIKVIGTPEGVPGIGGAVLTRDQIWKFDRTSLDLAVNLLPGVVSHLDSNGRRNESDIFVRGFGRWQVPLMLDGVRIYLPADNRLDFSRFLTADIAAVQVQKGYASVLDGPGAMGGAINLVTRKPSRKFEAEGSASIGGRRSDENWNGYAMVGTRQDKFYAQGSVTFQDRDLWTLSSDYTPTANSLQPAGQRISSDSTDSRFNVKAGFTPNATDEYTIDFIKQDGDKGAPLNVLTNPLVPPNSFWRWPYWDIQNTSLLTHTQLSSTSYVKGKLYYNTFKNLLSAYDDITYTTQSANGRFNSPYDDHAWGLGVEYGIATRTSNTIKTALYYRRDEHTEQNDNRPTNPTARNIEPLQTQSQYTWSLAAEDTFHARRDLDVVAGVSYERYEITRAEEFNATAGVFELPKGGADSFNWQGGVIWRPTSKDEVHASVSDRTRFPVIFELYSTRFGTAVPNPDLGPERATNIELGWKTDRVSRMRFESSIFYSDVRDLIQTVQLTPTTTQTQNVGDGRFVGIEFSVNATVTATLQAGVNYTALSRKITDDLIPNLQPTGVPTHKAFLYATWTPLTKLSITPSLDLAGDRWSEMNNGTTPTPYLRTGQYTLFNISAEYAIVKGLDVVGGFKNLSDDDYQLSWGLPQQGRTFYFKTRISY